MDAKPFNWTLRSGRSDPWVAAFIFGREDRKKVERQFDSGARIARRVYSHSLCNWRRDGVGVRPGWTERLPIHFCWLRVSSWVRPITERFKNAAILSTLQTSKAPRSA